MLQSENYLIPATSSPSSKIALTLSPWRVSQYTRRIGSVPLKRINIQPPSSSLNWKPSMVTNSVTFNPPSVFGWDWETAWISSAALLARYRFARDVTSARGGSSRSFRPERLIDLSLSDPGDIVDAVTDVFGTATEGQRNVPDLGAGDEARGIQAVFMHNRQLVFVIDVDKVAAPAEVVDVGIAQKLLGEGET